MLRKTVSGVMLTLLLMNTLTLAFKVQPAKVEPLTWAADDHGQEDFQTTQEAINAANPGDTYWPSIKNWLMPATGSDFTNRLAVGEMDDLRARARAPYRWSLPNKMDWSKFACVHSDSAELVIGLDAMRSYDYPELLDLIVGDSGKLVNTVSMDGRVAAVVTDIPLEVVSVFVSEVEVSRLSRYIEPDVRFHIDFTPNDPYWSYQWGPQKIAADWAWNTTTGNSSIIVAVVDTGIDYNHPDLAANYAPLGYDWVNNDPDPMDDSGHGTHVAGTIAAVINNGVGIAGLANVRIMAEKVMDASGSGSASEIAEGIVHAVDQGARIINLSLGSYSDSELLHEAVRYAHVHGVLVVAAAGNDATNLKHYPSAYDEVVAVSATDESDNPATFTNYGEWVDVAAPGVNIYSTMPTYHVTLNDNGFNLDYDYMSGTSMACPHAVGVAALIWSVFPNMTRDQVRAQLQYCSDDLGEPGFDVYYGFGRVNARKAVEQALTDHDVLVLSLETDANVSLGKTVVINTTVLNMGNSNESGVTVQLLVNSSVVNSTTIDFLMSGASTTVSFSLNTTIEGVCNVTSYVVPETGETILGNNALSKQIRVILPRVIRVPDDYDTIQRAVDAANAGDTVSVASGTYKENVLINKESLTLVGQGSSNTIIDGNGMYDVIDVSADDVQISHFTIRNSGKEPDYYPPLSGILVYSCKGTTINDTVISDNLMGIGLFYSSGVTLRNNSMKRNTYNFGVDGDDLADFVHCIDGSNTADGKPLYYWLSEHDRQVPSDAGYVAVVNSTNIVVKDLNLTKNFEGVLFASTVNSSVENVNASDNYFGIYLTYSNNNTAHSNALRNNYAGIRLHESENNNINDNVPIDNTNGLSLYYSKDNTIDFNKLLDNDFGLLLEKSNNNTVANNKASNNTYGIYITTSSYNALKNNSMTANEYNFGVTGNHLSHFIQNIDVSNTVDGKSIYYWVNQEHKEVPADAGYVAVINSTNISVTDLNLTNNIQGVLFAFTTESHIENVKASNNTYGIYLYGSSNNTAVDNAVTSKGERGVQLMDSNNNIISNNLIANNYIGIGLWSSSENNTIDWNTVLNGTSGGAGLYLDGSNSNTVDNNVITNNYEGIILYESGMNTLRNNNMTSNSCNFGVYGVSLSHYIDDVDTSNIVNGKPIYYWINEHDKQVPTNAGYVAAVNSTAVTAKDLNLSNNEQAILLAYTTNSTLMNVTAWDNSNGIYLWSSDGNTISGNSLANNFGDGISLYYSDSNTIAHNTVTDNGIGIDATMAYYNAINDNMVLRNTIGIYLYYSQNSTVVMNKVTGGALALAGICLTEATGNVISENTVSENRFFFGAGIYLEWSSNDNTITENTITNNYYGLSIGYWGLYGLKDQNNNNTIYHNNLIENTKQALSLNSINTWDNGYPSGGNYWSVYNGVDLYGGAYQNESGSDGIGDTPYVIDENNRDRYPLMYPYGTPPPPTYALTITTVANGTTDPAPGTYLYSQGQNILVRAIPDTGYVLDHWQLDGVSVGSANPFSVLMDSNHALQAVFAPVYTLRITTTAGGTTSPSSGSYVYNAGTSVPVTAIADAYYSFDHWELDGLNIGSANPYLVLMDDNHALHAVFVQISYALTIATTAGGTTDPSSGVYTYAGGSSARVTAIPSADYVFDHWELDGTNIGAANPISVTMDTNHTLFGVFRALVHDVAVRNVAPSKTVVGQGFSMSMNVTVANYGDYTETFHVTVYADKNATIIGDEYMIGVSSVTLASGNSIVVTFQWNTTLVVLPIDGGIIMAPKGNYTVSAVADTVQGEINTANNICTDGIVAVAIKGDLNADGKVDMKDISLLERAFGTKPGDVRWNPNADINDDGKIDMKDISYVAKRFGQHDP